MRKLHLIAAMAALALAALSAPPRLSAQSPARQSIVEAILEQDVSRQREIIESLAGEKDEAIAPLLDAWKKDSLFLYDAGDGQLVPVQLVGEASEADGAQSAVKVADGQPLLDASGNPIRLIGSDMTAVEHSSGLRRSMKVVLDALDLVSPDPERRFKAVQKLGFAQTASNLPILRKMLQNEEDGNVVRALREAIAVTELKSGDEAAKIAALGELAELHSFSSADILAAALREAQEAEDAELVLAAEAAIRALDRHRSTVDFLGTIFRGVSTGSVLLVVALGLAITFGQMGVINMAHGEMIAIGAYTTYVVQNFFASGVTLPFFGIGIPIPGLGLEGASYNAYFLVALPLSFLTAAGVGILLERGVIQFLYRRPLESLLATWGVSLVLQQSFRLIFGANNVDVPRPSYLQGNFTVYDVTMGWPWLFVIGFGIAIVLGVWLLLTKTSLGLLIRAVMQNRAMAASLGVRTTRVDMLTFGLGSGLAGLAGAFASQINNVGPDLGQAYIVDSFMVVVVGGVGNIAGTVISAFGIGSIDQILQQYLPSWAPGLAGVPYIGNFLQNLGQDSAVFGKIMVLVGIILFLQWRPAGVFATRSRSLD